MPMHTWHYSVSSKLTVGRYILIDTKTNSGMNYLAGIKEGEATMQERKVYEYTVASEEDKVGDFSGKNRLVEKVNQLIKNGWQPIGGVACTGNLDEKLVVAPIQCWAQALVKYK